MTTSDQPVSYGKESGSFSKPHPIRPGACPICGALPACEKPKGSKR